MDMVPLAGMLFSLLLTMIVGGFILLFPLSRRLAAVLERKLREKDGDPTAPDELNALRTALHALENEVRALTERQAFVDALLAGSEPARLAAADSPPNAIGPAARPPIANHAHAPTVATAEPESHHG